PVRPIRGRGSMLLRTRRRWGLLLGLRPPVAMRVATWFVLRLHRLHVRRIAGIAALLLAWAAALALVRRGLGFSLGHRGHRLDFGPLLVVRATGLSRRSLAGHGGCLRLILRLRFPALRALHVRNRSRSGHHWASGPVVSLAGCRGGRRGQHGALGDRALRRRRHLCLLHLGPEDGEAVARDPGALMTLVRAHLGHLIARHRAANEALHLLHRHTPVHDPLINDLVFREAAGLAVDPFAVLARNRVLERPRVQETARRYEEVRVRRQRDRQRSGAEFDRRRQRRPADVVAPLLPGNPRRSVVVAGNPGPAVVGVFVPATIVIGRPAIRLGRDPDPAVVGPGPVAILIRTPGRRDGARRPDPTILRAFDPVAIGGQIVIEKTEVYRGTA